ncbi:bifunctional helix-turn-helix transcriptional regulator/GNAT family N-acetyltransferase [uncultured Lacinutrix sp.]|uniref:bifunctional helix-turn-helix transcriptional regulator/GNAT family N-acetyltransferase n=1 Tax=uncultured Lacinutrix sp. TaxID=574032 RepID=UPI002614640B|nr:bifunctional helix-turn-helix transcriptional regulator/GNAT family N-acetyltransferase [uncultured Lacinutrix sp.]
MDALRGFGELGLGSRLKRLSEYLMKETQLVYNHFNIDFDPYLFPVFKILVHNKGVTNTDIKNSLNLSQPAITQAINKLIKKELVIISSDKKDKRKKIVHLSKKGETLFVKLNPIWKDIDLVIKNFTLTTSSSLIEHLNTLEDKLTEQSLSSMIIQKAKMNTKSDLDIVTYKPKYATHFYNLNIEWLKTYFYVEPFDEEVLSKPDQYIIQKGGHIFFAILNNKVVGTVALMPLPKEDAFELTKMAVSPKHRGHKIGQQLMQYCIDYAKEHKFNRLLLYSNTVLENAIYIYRKYGFIELELEKNSPYKRSNIKMEYFGL